MQVCYALAAALTFATLGAGTVGRAIAAPSPVIGGDAPEVAVKAWLLSETAGYGALDYALAWIDLNGDRQAEAIVYLAGPSLCGTGGCTMYVLERQRSDFLIRARTTVTKPPISVLETRSHGWRDLAVNVRCLETTCPQARLRFDGSRYPSNPTTTPRVKELGIPAMIFLPELGTRPLRP